MVQVMATYCQQQAIAWTNVDPYLCQPMASQGHNDLNYCSSTLNIFLSHDHNAVDMTSLDNHGNIIFTRCSWCGVNFISNAHVYNTLALVALKHMGFCNDCKDVFVNVYPRSHKSMSPWEPLPGVLPWYPIFKWSPNNSFEDQVP